MCNVCSIANAYRYVLLLYPLSDTASHPNKTGVSAHERPQKLTNSLSESNQTPSIPLPPHPPARKLSLRTPVASRPLLFAHRLFHFLWHPTATYLTTGYITSPTSTTPYFAVPSPYTSDQIRCDNMLSLPPPLRPYGDG